MATPEHLMYLSLGTVLGMIVGILPGLGGIAGLDEAHQPLGTARIAC